MKVIYLAVILSVILFSSCFESDFDRKLNETNQMGDKLIKAFQTADSDSLPTIQKYLSDFYNNIESFGTTKEATLTNDQKRKLAQILKKLQKIESLK